MVEVVMGDQDASELKLVPRQHRQHGGGVAGIDHKAAPAAAVAQEPDIIVAKGRYCFDCQHG